MRSPLGRGELYAGLAAMSYGSAYVATGFALRSFEPATTAAYRSVLATLVLGLILAVRSRRSAVRRDVAGAVSRSAPTDATVRRQRLGHLLMLGSLGGAIFLAGQSLAVAHVGATVAAFVAGLYAVIAAVLAPTILREPLRRQALIGFILALIGTALLAKLDPATSDLVGLAWGLTAAVSFAFFLVLARKWSVADGFDGVMVAFATVAVGSVALGLLAIATESESLVPPSVRPEAAIALVWLVFVAAVGQALTAASVRLIPASRSAAFLLLNPITATVLAAALLGERPAPIQLAGGLLVLMGIAAATVGDAWPRRPRRIRT